MHETGGLYREVHAGIHAFAPVDPALIPDCGARRIDQLHGEIRQREHDGFIWSWTCSILTAALCLVSVATFRDSPLIFVTIFFITRPIGILAWLRHEHVRDLGAEISRIRHSGANARIVHENRLRTQVGNLNARLRSYAEHARRPVISNAQRRALAEAGELEAKRDRLLQEICAFRNGTICN